MDLSIALATSAPSRLGYAAACLLAREVLVSGRGVAQIKETAAQLTHAMRRPWVERFPA